VRIGRRASFVLSAFGGYADPQPGQIAQLIRKQINNPNKSIRSNGFLQQA